jgi:hypothetical protein
MKRIFLSIAAIIFILFVFGGCASNVQMKIIGKWEMQSFVKNPTTKVVWEFTADGKITKTINDNKSYTGNYRIIPKSFKEKFNSIDISGLTDEYGEGALANDDGRYVIHKLTSDELVIERVEAYGRTEGVYKWYEFLKK